MKRLLTAVICVMMIAMLAVPAFAAENKIVYSQDFDSVSSFDQLGWEVAEALNKNTGAWTVEGGKLIIDNMGADSADSYYIVVPAKIMDSVVKDDYTVQYDVKLIDAGDAKRYCALIENYDRSTGSSYTSFHARMNGLANWQARVNGEWPWQLDQYGDVAGYTVSGADGSICSVVFGEEYEDGKYVMQNKTMTIRIEFHKDGNVSVFVNNVLVSGNDKDHIEDYQTNSAFSEIALKASKLVKAEVDNIVVASGIGIPAPEAAPAVTETASAETPAAVPAAQTMDLCAAFVLVAAGAAVLAKKH